MINIVGLGASDEKALSLGALEIINNGRKNFLRTEKHEAVSYFINHKISYKSFDYIYEDEKSLSFEDVYGKIVEILLREEKENGVINYYVPGNPFVAEKTVSLLIEKTATNVIKGMSFIDDVLAQVKRDAVDGLLFLDSDFDLLDINPSMDILITQIYNNRIASDTSIKLQEIYSPDHEVILLIDAGLKSQRISRNKLYLLPRQEGINHQTALYVPRIREDKRKILISYIEKLIDDKNLSYSDEVLNIIGKKMIKEAKNLRANDDNSLARLYFLINLLLGLGNREGFFNKALILETILQKIRENSDFF